MKGVSMLLPCACLMATLGCGASSGLYSDGEACKMASRIATYDLRGDLRLNRAMADLGIDLSRLPLLGARHSSLAKHSSYRLSRSFFLHLVTEFIVVPRDEENPRVSSVVIDGNAPE